MRKKLKVLSASALLLGCISTQANAAYWTYGNGGDYIGKLTLEMDGSGTRWGTAGTYIADDRYIVNTITAELIDNGVSKGYASNSMTSRATTQTKIVNYNGVDGHHSIVSPSHGNWYGTT